MIYIKLEEENNCFFEEDIFIKTVNRFKKIFNKIKIEKIENIGINQIRTMVIIKNVRNKTLQKLTEYIKQNCVNLVCLSDNLLINSKFIGFIKNENVRILDGRWLYKHLIGNIVDYISNCKNEKIDFQEISILTHDINRIVISTIKELALKVRALNVLTDKEKMFRNIEKELYSEYGIILNMNNNYKRSLTKSDIIINFDFTEEELIRYNLPKNACIINLERKIELDSKKFEGISTNFYEITMPSRYIKSLIILKGFNTENLYESFIYKNTSPENIKNEILKDKVNIISLIGKNGIIRKKEFQNISKKVIN